MSDQRPQFPALVLSNNELYNIVKMCETAIVFVEAADKIYDLDNGQQPVKLVQNRSAAAQIQAKCQMELARRQAEHDARIDAQEEVPAQGTPAKE